MTNYGLNLKREYQDRQPTDYKFGAKKLTGLGDKVKGLVIAVHAWPNVIEGIYQRTSYILNHVVILYNKKFSPYFPKGEAQNIGGDKKDCVTRGHINEIEKQLNYILENGLFTPLTVSWLNDNGYIIGNGNRILLSNRIPAMGSNTTRNGNSIKAPIEWIRKNGIHPRAILDESKPMSFSEYHDKSNMTKERLDLGLESKKYIKINYEVDRKNMFSKVA